MSSESKVLSHAPRYPSFFSAVYAAFSALHPCFPHEIIAHIVSFLDVETLGGVACASKSLCALARPHLFSRILVSTENDLGTLDSEIARHVRRARFLHKFAPPRWLAPRVLRPLLEHATRLRSIHISVTETPEWGPPTPTLDWDQYSNNCRTSLVAALSIAEEVVLDDIACLPASVLRKLQNVKRLETAYFPCPDIDLADEIGFSSRPAPISFAVSGWISCTVPAYSEEDDWGALQSLNVFDFSNLKRFYLFSPEPMSSPLIIKVLSQCQQTLKSLRLHFDGEAEDETKEAIVYLSHMKSLQELYIAATSDCGPLICFSAVVNAILFSLDTRLENIQLIVNAGNEADWTDSHRERLGHNDGPGEEWNVLDGKINELLIMQPELQVVLRLPQSLVDPAYVVHQFVAQAMPASSKNERFILDILEIQDPRGIRSLFKLDDLKF